MSTWYDDHMCHFTSKFHTARQRVWPDNNMFFHYIYMTNMHKLQLSTVTLTFKRATCLLHATRLVDKMINFASLFQKPIINGKGMSHVRNYNHYFIFLINTYIYSYIHIHPSVRASVHPSVHAYIYPFIQARTHAHILTYEHTDTYTQTYIYTYV